MVNYSLAGTMVAPGKDDNSCVHHPKANLGQPARYRSGLVVWGIALER